MTKKVVVDAGHGADPKTGKGDPGATNGGLWESAATLAVAKLLRKELEAEGFDVVMTREGNEFLTLAERCRISNEANAAAFVSIHCNSAENKDAHGIETWRFSKVGQTTKALAENVQKRMIDVTGARNRGIKEGSFFVLKNTKAPAVLCEIGFISHNEESRKLFTTRYQTAIAKAIAQGVFDTMK